MNASIFEAVSTFLEGEQGDIRKAVKAEIPDLLAPEAVTVARATRGRQPRRENAPPVTVEIVPVSPWRREVLGIGEEAVHAAFDLKTTLRRKDSSAGRAQLPVVAAVAEILSARYGSACTLPLAAPPAVFRYATAEILKVDEVPESYELARSVVRVTFHFTRERLD